MNVALTHIKEWCKYKISELSYGEKPAVKAGPFGSTIKKEDYVPFGYKVYGQEQVIKNDPFYGDYYISEEKYTQLSSCAVASGDILVSLVGTVGKVLIVPDNFELGVINPRLIRISLDKTITFPPFIKLILEAKKTNRLLNRWAQGGTMGVLNAGMFQNLPVLLPPLPEQKAIADVMTTWDEAIEKTKGMIQAKERLKHCEFRSLISSQKVNSTIGKFVKLVVRKIDKPDQSYTALGIRSHFKGTFQRVVEDPKTVNMDTLYRVKENDLILNITFAWEGAIALVKKDDENCYVSHRFPTYEIQRKKAEPIFIRQLIMSSRMKYDLANISPGGAGRNRVLNKKDFLKMPVWLPDLEKQKSIGEYLEALDREIDLLKQLREKYILQKCGLMQKLLTGEWRIKHEIVNKYKEGNV